MTLLRAVCRGVEAILAVSSAVASLIVVCVAGTTLSQLNIPSTTPPDPDVHIPPAIGKPATIFALVAACPNIFMSFAIAVLRILQIRLSGITFNRVVVIIFSCGMMFYGSIIIASLCAAGILSAIAAASPSNDIEDNAVSYLIGTSVSSFVAFLVMVCFMLYEMVAGLCTETN